MSHWTTGLAEGMLAASLCAMPVLIFMVRDALPLRIRSYLWGMTKATLAIAVLLPASQSEAGPFRRVCRQCAPAIKVVTQQVAVPVAPVAFVLAPTSQPSSYGAAQYSPPLRDRARSEATSSGFQAELNVLVAAIQKLTDRLDAIEGNLGAPGADYQIPQIVRQQCGKCHSGNAADGDGITFADIATTKNDRAQLAVIKGTMPKIGDEAEPIAPEIRQALVAALESMKR